MTQNEGFGLLSGSGKIHSAVKVNPELILPPGFSLQPRPAGYEYRSRDEGFAIGMEYPYYMAHRTTLLLDDATRAAARELAARMQVSVSEAIRRAILESHGRARGISPADRQQRLKALAELVKSFEGYDPQDELRALAEDDGF